MTKAAAKKATIIEDFKQSLARYYYEDDRNHVVANNIMATDRRWEPDRRKNYLSLNAYCYLELEKVYKENLMEPPDKTAVKGIVAAYSSQMMIALGLKDKKIRKSYGCLDFWLSGLKNIDYSRADFAPELLPNKFQINWVTYFSLYDQYEELQYSLALIKPVQQCYLRLKGKAMSSRAEKEFVARVRKYSHQDREMATIKFQANFFVSKRASKSELIAEYNLVYADAASYYELQQQKIDAGYALVGQEISLLLSGDDAGVDRCSEQERKLLSWLYVLKSAYYSLQLHPVKMTTGLTKMSAASLSDLIKEVKIINEANIDSWRQAILLNGLLEVDTVLRKLFFCNYWTIAELDLQLLAELHNTVISLRVDFDAAEHNSYKTYIWQLFDYYAKILQIVSIAQHVRLPFNQREINSALKEDKLTADLLALKPQIVKYLSLLQSLVAADHFDKLPFSLQQTIKELSDNLSLFSELQPDKFALLFKPLQLPGMVVEFGHDDKWHDVFIKLHQEEARWLRLKQLAVILSLANGYGIHVGYVNNFIVNCNTLLIMVVIKLGEFVEHSKVQVKQNYIDALNRVALELINKYSSSVAELENLLIKLGINNKIGLLQNLRVRLDFLSRHRPARYLLGALRLLGKVGVRFVVCLTHGSDEQLIKFDTIDDNVAEILGWLDDAISNNVNFGDSLNIADLRASYGKIDLLVGNVPIKREIQQGFKRLTDDERVSFVELYNRLVDDLESDVARAIQRLRLAKVHYDNQSYIYSNSSLVYINDELVMLGEQLRDASCHNQCVL